MKKLFVIGGIVSGAVVAVAALGIAAYTFLPTAAFANPGVRQMPRMMEGAMSFEGRGQFGPDQFGPMGPGGPRGFGDQIDWDGLLADALGITVDELQTARDQARAAGLQQAVDQGLVTQEQADLMTAGYKLRDYIDRDQLMAKALGISVEELQAARDEGKPLPVIIYEQGLDPATVRTNMQTALEETIQQAVTDGVITQEQADQFKNGPGFGFDRDGFGRPGGRGGRGGGFDGFGGWK